MYTALHNGPTHLSWARQPIPYEGPNRSLRRHLHLEGVLEQEQEQGQGQERVQGRVQGLVVPYSGRCSPKAQDPTRGHDHGPVLRELLVPILVWTA